MASMRREESRWERGNGPKIKRFLNSVGVIGGIGTVTSSFSGKGKRGGCGGLVLGLRRYWSNGSISLAMVGEDKKDEALSFEGSINIKPWLILVENRS